MCQMLKLGLVWFDNDTLGHCIVCIVKPWDFNVCILVITDKKKIFHFACVA